MALRRLTALLLSLLVTSLTVDSLAPSESRRNVDRRAFLVGSSQALLSFLALPSLAADSSILLDQLQQAQQQLSTVPPLLEQEKWDSVRAILLKPPLSDCWSKNPKLLTHYAASVGENAELDALEGKEELVSHLRYLDMAVYNNVFNPIATEGTAGATKELVRSYYEDPINEWKASTAALQGLIDLSR